MLWVHCINRCPTLKDDNNPYARYSLQPALLLTKCICVWAECTATQQTWSGLSPTTVPAPIYTPSISNHWRMVPITHQSTLGYVSNICYPSIQWPLWMWDHPASTAVLFWMGSHFLGFVNNMAASMASDHPQWPLGGWARIMLRCVWAGCTATNIQC